MDPIGTAASLISLRQACTEIVKCLHDVEGGAGERSRLLIEVISTNGVLQDLVEKVKSAKSNPEPWSSTIRSLSAGDGPIVLLGTLLGNLRNELSSANKPGVDAKLLWPFKKAEIKARISVIERQKWLLAMALTNDHVALSREIQKSTTEIRVGVEEISMDYNIFQRDEMGYGDWILGYIRYRDNESETGPALHLVILNRNDVTGAVFLEHGADISVIAGDCDPLFHVVSRTKEVKEDGIKFLLSKGAKVDVLDRSGRTPLLIAAGQGYEGVVSILLAAGADVSAADKAGRTALHQTAIRGHEGVARQLLDAGANPNARAPVGKFSSVSTSLCFAIFFGHAKIVRLLIDHGADINLIEEDGITPLEVALIVASRNERGGEIVKMLLERGAGGGSNGRNSLSYAAENGIEDLVRDLIATRNEDPNACDNIFSRSPLFYACMRGHEGTARALLGINGVDAGAKDHWSATPLSMAARFGHEGVVRLLLEREDAGLADQDRSGRTALSWAALKGQETIVQLITKGYIEKGLILPTAPVAREDKIVESPDGNSRGLYSRGLYIRSLYCDVCCFVIPRGKVDYHSCNICASGDFDVCASCFAGGMHCLDDSHELEMVKAVPENDACQ